jgi:hypothetical protein
MYSSKIHAKFIRNMLVERQIELGLIENLSINKNKKIDATKGSRSTATSPN